MKDCDEDYRRKRTPFVPLWPLSKKAVIGGVMLAPAANRQTTISLSSEVSVASTGSSKVQDCDSKATAKTPAIQAIDAIERYFGLGKKRRAPPTLETGGIHHLETQLVQFTASRHCKNLQYSVNKSSTLWTTFIKGALPVTSHRANAQESLYHLEMTKRSLERLDICQ